MSPREDRSTGGLLAVYGAAGVLAILIAAGGLFLWHRSGGPSEEQAAPGQVRQQIVQTFRRDESVTISLFYPSEGLLSSGTASVGRQPDIQSLARLIVATLLADQRNSHTPLLGELNLRELYLDDQGTVYVDLSIQPGREIRASAWEEILAVYAIVNSLTRNIEEIRQVSILIDGKEAQTLAGHLDLLRKFSKRADLIRS